MAVDIRDLVAKLELEHIYVPIVACGIENDARAAVAAIHAGAKEYIPLPPDPDLIAAVLKVELLRLRLEARDVVGREHRTGRIDGVRGRGEQRDVAAILLAAPELEGVGIARQIDDAQPGLLGRQVKLDMLDDGFDPNQAAADYTRLISQDHVSLLLGTFSSLLNAPASAIAARRPPTSTTSAP